MNAKLIIAVDAVGVGALAGPITAGAVIYPVNAVEPVFGYQNTRGYQKQRFLSEPDKMPNVLRDAIREHVRSTALAYAVMVREAPLIRALGTKRALAEAMSLAVVRATERLKHMHADLVSGLTYQDVHIYVAGDVQLLPELVHEALPQFPNREDWRLGAAQVVARAAHTQTLENLARKYPEYGFERHGGYSSQEHRRALKKLGPTPEHRKS